MKYFMRFIYFIFFISLFLTVIAFSIGTDFDGSELTGFGNFLKSQQKYSPHGCTVVGTIIDIKEIGILPEEGKNYYEVTIDAKKKYSVQSFGAVCKYFGNPVVLNMREDNVSELNFEVGANIKVASTYGGYRLGRPDQIITHWVRNVGPWHREIFGNIAYFLFNISFTYLFLFFIIFPSLLFSFLIIIIRLIVIKRRNKKKKFS